MSNNQQQRAKRHERLEVPPPMRMTARDLSILDAVYRYRVLTQTHIQRLIFTGLNPNVANRRLHLLYHNGYLERQFLPVRGGIMTSPILYLLDKRGGEYLLQHSNHDEIRWKSRDNKVSYQHLEHLLAINQFRLEVKLATQHFHREIEVWLDDTTLHQEPDRVRLKPNTKPISIIPDSYFRLSNPYGKSFHFFLELDRGTMDGGRFKRKILAYQQYKASGLIEKRYGTENFRVLTVTLDSDRCHQLREVTEQAGGQRQFWFGVLGELHTETVLSAPVWQVATYDQATSLIKPEQLA